MYVCVHIYVYVHLYTYICGYTLHMSMFIYNLYPFLFQKEFEAKTCIFLIKFIA